MFTHAKVRIKIVPCLLRLYESVIWVIISVIKVKREVSKGAEYPWFRCLFESFKACFRSMGKFYP